MSRFYYSVASILALSMILVGSTGCTTAGPHTVGGGVTGAAGGGLLGAAIGAHDGKPIEGALVGAAIGSAVGATAGNQVDQFEQREQTRRFQEQQLARSQAVNIDQIIKMSANGLDSQVIINQIRAQGVVARPNAEQLIWLRNQGVPNEVIAAMQNAPIAGQLARRGRVAPVVYQEHVIVEPGCYVRPYPRRFHRHPRRRGFGVEIDF